jgi:6,7-dimethyl-8-ribityllumazine synthase
MTKILIIEARFYDHIADGLLAGATQVLEAAGATVERLTVPGIFEIPAALTLVQDAAEAGTGPAYDGFVTLGCAIKGETDHYDFISAHCMRSVGEISNARRLALGNGVLTVHTEEQALVRADPARKDIGGMAARACLRMLDLKLQLKR